MTEPLSMMEAVDLVRQSQAPAVPETEAPDTAVEQGEEIELEGGADGVDLDADAEAITDPEQVEAEEAEEEDADEVEAAGDTEEESADTEDDSVELPPQIEVDEDGNFVVRAKIFGEDVLEPLDKVIARAQKDMAVDNRLDEAKNQAHLAFETQKAAQAQLAMYSQLASDLEQELTAVQQSATLTPEQEARLQEQNPKALLELKKLQEARETRLQQVRDQQAQAQAAFVQDQAGKVFELLPEWSDPEIRTRETAGVATAARNAGFSDDEINGIVDARLLPVFRKAWLYDQGQAKAKTVRKKAKAAPKVVKKKPPVAQPSESQRRQKAAQDRFQKTGSIDDAVAALLARRSS